MASEGYKQVELLGSDDKRQITAVFGATLMGDFLSLTIWYSIWWNDSQVFAT